MKIDYYKIPEIRVSYKDRVKTVNRLLVASSANTIKILRLAYKKCMQHHEEANVLYLNRGGRILGISCVSSCGVSSAAIDIKIIMQIALKVHASSIIFSHNHPSGTRAPSSTDIKLTRKLKDACELLDINFLDHIIITQDSYYSFADEGLL